MNGINDVSLLGIIPGGIGAAVGAWVAPRTGERTIVYAFLAYCVGASLLVISPACNWQNHTKEHGSIKAPYAEAANNSYCASVYQGQYYPWAPTWDVVAGLGALLLMIIMVRGDNWWLMLWSPLFALIFATVPQYYFSDQWKKLKV